MIRPNVEYPETPFPEGSAMHEVRLLALAGFCAQRFVSRVAAHCEPSCLVGPPETLQMCALQCSTPVRGCCQHSLLCGMPSHKSTACMCSPAGRIASRTLGSTHLQVPCGGWELVASFAEEVAAIAEPLCLSDHKRDQRIAAAVRAWMALQQGHNEQRESEVWDLGYVCQHTR